MIDTYIFFALAFTGIYAVMMTIEVWSLRAKMRDMRSIYCKKCKCQIPAVCPRCTPPSPVCDRMGCQFGAYRTNHPPETPPPLKAPGPGRERIG